MLSKTNALSIRVALATDCHHLLHVIAPIVCMFYTVVLASKTAHPSCIFHKVVLSYDIVVIKKAISMGLT